MKLLVIIVTYNGMKWIDKCLSSVNNSTIKADLFIVDNGSTDGTIEYIKEQYPEAHFIISKENLGFGRANNLGLRFALDNNYDFVYLLNQDAWVEENTFKNLIRINNKYPEYYIISPLQTNKEKTKLDANFSKFCSVDMSSDYICNQQPKEIYETDCAMAAHWMMSNRCIQDVGGFSPTFKHYGEDINYIDRIHYIGK